MTDVSDLHAEYHRTRNPKLREELLAAHRPFAYSVARTFAGRGEDIDDLRQVAMLALLKSIDRFDPDRGFKFSSYASLVISGELKRHFRDRGWAVRVPRPLQELHLRTRRVTDDLRAELGRAPTVPELAVALEATEEEVVEAIEAGGCYRVGSLDAPAGDDGAPRWATLGGDDANLDSLERRDLVDDLLARLTPGDRLIVRLYYVDGLSQADVGRRLGVSQVHVSRRLARAVDRLRALAPAHV